MYLYRNQRFYSNIGGFLYLRLVYRQEYRVVQISQSMVYRKPKHNNTNGKKMIIVII